MAGKIRKAAKEKIWLKVLLSGPSGSGKTYSALRVATGIASKYDGKIGMISTEGSRADYYSNNFDYDVIDLDPPYSIDKYLDALHEFINAGYKVVLVDSISAEWKWLNDTHDRMPGNSFQNWGKLKPKHRAFMDELLYAPVHLIATARTKTDWVIDEKNGKQAPKKVGLAAIQDGEISYEYTLSFQVDQTNHISVADKDNTGLFDGVYEVLTEESGVKMWAWANEGNATTVVHKSESAVEREEMNQSYNATSEVLSDLKKQIIITCKEKGGTQNADLMSILKQYVSNGNPNAIKDLDTAKECLAKIQSL